MGVSLLAQAGTFAAYTIALAATANHVRSLTLPGEPLPDTSTLEGTLIAALAASVLGIGIAASSVRVRGRAPVTIACVYFLFSFGWAVWWLLAGDAWVSPLRLGPLLVSPVLVASVSLIISIGGMASAFVLWLREPADDAPSPPPMPPPTHQA